MAELTLAVSSATGVMVVGLGRGQQVLTESVFEAARRHAEEIAPTIVGVLTEADVTVADIDRLVVDVGPGLFTGLRVGLATVKGLAFALNIPVVGLTSLNILAATEPGSNTVTAVVDARRGEVFQQVFVDGEPKGEALVGPAEELAGRARGVVLGDGLDRYRQAYEDFTELSLLSGRHATVAAMLNLANGDPGQPGNLVTPFYLRDPDVNPNVKVRAGVDGADR